MVSQTIFVDNSLLLAKGRPPNVKSEPCPRDITLKVDANLNSLISETLQVLTIDVGATQKTSGRDGRLDRPVRDLMGIGSRRYRAVACCAVCAWVMRRSHTEIDTSRNGRASERGGCGGPAGYGCVNRDKDGQG